MTSILFLGCVWIGGENLRGWMNEFKGMEKRSWCCL